MVWHLASLWNRGSGLLRNGLLEAQVNKFVNARKQAREIKQSRGMQVVEVV